MSEEKFRTEEFHVNGEELLARIKKLVHEGNIRRIIIKNKDGRRSHRNSADRWSSRRVARPDACRSWSHRGVIDRGNRCSRKDRCLSLPTVASIR